MSESEQQYEEDFFGNAFKFLDVPQTVDTPTGESTENEQTERPHFKIKDYTKEDKPETPRVLDPEHPLLDRFQKALREHLLKQIDYLSEDVFALETATKKKDAEREKLGIETYDTQQVVCKQQKVIEEYMSEIEGITAAREELEKQMETLSIEHHKEREKLFEAEKKEMELRNEVEGVSHLLQKMTCWENEVETELKTNLRISEKTKKDKIKLAAEKRELDMIIYRLMTEVWRLENEIETMDMQLRVKEEEKERIAIAVALSSTDIEALEAENRCLLQSWNSVINAITNRDKTFVSIQKELRDANEQIKSTITEIDQIKKMCNKEMIQNETLTLFKNRVMADMKNCTHILEGEITKRDELEKKIVGYQNIIDATDKTIQVVNGESIRKENEFHLLIKDYEKLAREKVEIEEKILQLLQDQITNDKAGEYLNKLVRQIKQKNRDMEITLASVENINAKTLMDIEAQKFINENSSRLLDEMYKKQDELNSEIKKLTNDIEKLQFTMRRKQREFDILNKHLESAKAKLTSKSGSSHEEEMRDLEKQIEEIELNIKSLQKYWLREQENMVVLTQQRQEQIKDNNLIRKQIMILEQKNLKIGDELEALKKQDDKMNRSITSLLSRQTMLQEAFNKKKGNKEELGRDNILMQTEYTCQLEEAEMEALRLQAELEEMDESKVNLSKDLIERNREALAWEKKLQLAVETKQNMNEEQSAEGEIGHMKAEIHRMTVRYSQLKKAQDKLITDLEQCVTRREAIVTVADAREKRACGTRLPKINYHRKLDDLRNKTKKVQMEIEEVDKEIDETNKQEENLKADIRRTDKQIFSLEEQTEIAKHRIEYAITEKQQMLELLVLKQRKLQMLNDLARNRPIKMLYREEALQDMEFQRQIDINEKLRNILSNLITDYPQFEQVLQRILNTLKMSLEFTD